MLTGSMIRSPTGQCAADTLMPGGKPDTKLHIGLSNRIARCLCFDEYGCWSFFKGVVCGLIDSRSEGSLDPSFNRNSKLRVRRKSKRKVKHLMMDASFLRVRRAVESDWDTLAKLDASELAGGDGSFSKTP